MARAAAECTCKTCGKTFYRYAVKRNSTEARAYEEWAAKNFDECDECRRKRIEEERAAHSKECAEAAADRSWPELEGTPKQVAWAVTIREEKAGAAVEDAMRRFRNDEERRAIALRAVDEITREQTSAKFWIDDRGDGFRKYEEMIARRIDEIREGRPEPEPVEKTIAEPQGVSHAGTVTVRVKDKAVEIIGEKDDALRDAAKGLGYCWNRDRGAWTLVLDATAGKAEDRMAEAGSVLLNRGFRVQFPDSCVMGRAVSAEYEPRHTRWVYATVKGQFGIKWARDEGSEGIYAAAISLPYAKYVPPAVLVAPKHWEAVEDFAGRFGFRLTKGAERLMAAEKAKVLHVVPEAAKQPAYAEKGMGAEPADLSDLVDDE